MFQMLSRDIYNARSYAEMDAAKKRLERYIASPESKASLDYMQKGGFFSGDRDDSSIVSTIRGVGKGLIPAGATATSDSISALTDPGQLGSASRAMDGYSIDKLREIIRPNADGSPGRPFRTVAELVLWEMENSPKGTFRSVPQVLSDLEADGVIVAPKDPKTLSMTQSFLRGISSDKPYGKNSAIVERLQLKQTPPAAASATPPPVIGAPRQP
jgi:hypothetical protein